MATQAPALLNWLTINSYLITIDRLPGLEWSTQQTNLPGCGLGSPELPTYLKDVPMTPDTMSYDDLTLSFLVQEDLSNWLAIYQWMKAMTQPEDFSQFGQVPGPAISSPPMQNIESSMKSDIGITLLSNLKNPILTINYKDAFPISLSGLDLSVTEQDAIPVASTVTFKFSDFEVVTLG